jgi:hypothetical protein
MTENADSKNKHISDVLEETFKRYEKKKEPPSFPVLDQLQENQQITRQQVARPVNSHSTSRSTPLVEVRQPAQISTGISGLDNILGGGIADHSLILVFGEPGSYHETFIQQLLYNHVMEQGKVGYYNVQTLSSDIRVEMEKFNWNLEDSIRSNSWTFVNLRTDELQALADLAPSALSDEYSVKLTSGLANLKNDLLGRIKQDRWTAMELSQLLLSYDLREITDLMLYWRAAIRVYGGIHFAFLPTGVHSESQVNALKNMGIGFNGAAKGAHAARLDEGSGTAEPLQFK